MGEILSQKFFEGNALEAAENLIGKYLVIKSGKSEKAKMITEVEAYAGPDDKASHAHKGKTERTKVMFGPPGYWYVYLIYGMYWMLNIVAGPEEYPAAILIRGVEDVDGPGRITKKFGVNGRFNEKPAEKKTGLWIEDRGVEIAEKNIERTSRVGVQYASEWAEKPYRFILKN